MTMHAEPLLGEATSSQLTTLLGRYVDDVLILTDAEQITVRRYFGAALHCLGRSEK